MASQGKREPSSSPLPPPTTTKRTKPRQRFSVASPSSSSATVAPKKKTSVFHVSSGSGSGGFLTPRRRGSAPSAPTADIQMGLANLNEQLCTAMLGVVLEQDGHVGQWVGSIGGPCYIQIGIASPQV
jgi:hypothetical protein